MLTCADPLTELIQEVRPGYSLPRPFYADETIHAEDLRRIYMRQWLYVGHACQIPKAGDFFTYRLGDEPVIVTRAKDGQIHAVYNVCRHRGSLLCTTEQGHCNKFVCPYHQWVFDHDGSLLSARRMPETFDRSQHGLKTVHVRLLEDLIFLCFAPTPPPFDPMVESLAEILKPHGLPLAQVCTVRNYTVEANWKLVVENSRECYHCQFGHPEYSELMLSNPASPEHVAACVIQEKDRYDHYEKLGLTTKPARGAGYSLARYPFMRKGAVSESQDGKPVAPLMGAITDRDAGVVGGYMFPNFMIECSSDYTVVFRFTPLSARRTAIQATWFVRAGSVEGRDYDVKKVIWFWRVTGEQDWKLCADNQAGVNSTQYEPGPYSPEEVFDVGRFQSWYLSQLARAE